MIIILGNIFCVPAFGHGSAGRAAGVIAAMRSQPPGRVRLRGRVLDEKGEPLAGASVSIRGTNKTVLTNDRGAFELTDKPGRKTILISSVGFETRSLPMPSGDTELVVRLRSGGGELTPYTVTYTDGLQKIPKERATGSFSMIDSSLFNRAVTPYVFDRLDGLVPGPYFTGAPATNITYTLPSRNLNLTVRGVSSINGGLVDGGPLLVVDGFAFEGDIRNLNPDDIESVSLLKDAAASSIWGSRSGNGVLVIVTKRGRRNQTQVNLNINTIITGKPNLFKDRNFLPAPYYIGVEDSLFGKGYFTPAFTDPRQPSLSPVIDLRRQEQEGTISAPDADNQVNAFRKNDLRRDLTKYVYRAGVAQDYSLGLSGGGKHMTYLLSLGLLRGTDNLVRNGFQRTTVRATHTYTPLPNLEITGSLSYSQSLAQMNNNESWGNITMGGKYGKLAPYELLADPHGQPLATTKDHPAAYSDSMRRLGYPDQSYRPLDELKLADITSRNAELWLRIGAKYSFVPGLSLEVQYENEHQTISNRNDQSVQSYAVRSRIAEFAVYDPATHLITYNFPRGDILNLDSYDWNARNLRGQLAFNRVYRTDHVLAAIAGAEIRELRTTGYSRNSYGYDPQFGTSVSSLNYNTPFPINPTGTAYLPPIDGSVSGSLYRYISYYSNAAYTYKERYTLSGSARKDGANLYGGNINDRFAPLWSMGAAWNVNREAFLLQNKSIAALKLRATFGYSGNAYNGSAFASGTYVTGSLTNQSVIANLQPANLSLSWERIRNMNLGLDFGLTGKSGGIWLDGSVDLYQKNGQNLIEAIALAPSTGFSSYNGNAAATRTRGMELILTSHNLRRAFTWNTTGIFNSLHDAVTKYDDTLTVTSFQVAGQSGVVAVKGRPLFSVFAYRWAGLDPATGDPQGYLGKAVSKQYSPIINNFKSDSLQYFGSARPTVWGAIRNDFGYRGFSLSVNIGFKFGYYLRRPSITGNLADIIGTGANVDYIHRWQRSGDEKVSSIPSEVYPSNSSRSLFYQYSAALVSRADHIRLQDIKCSYDFKRSMGKAGRPVNFQLYAYASNITILWRANHYGIDPDRYSYYGTNALPNPLTLALGARVNF